MGRAIVRRPQVFLMDEPLSNLDAKLRVQMRAEISQLQDELGVTTIYVTHDQVEAMTMGDRVAVMRKGRLQQVAAPQEVYDRPVNLFVGGFIGSPSMNVLEARLERDGDGLAFVLGDARLAIGPGLLEDRPAISEYAGRTVIVGIRPETLEDAALAPDAPPDRRMRGQVELREALGSEIVAHVRVPGLVPARTEEMIELARDIGDDGAPAGRGDAGATVVGRFGARSQAQEGDTIEMAVDTEALHVFDPESGLAIYQEVPRPEEVHDGAGQGAVEEPAVAAGAAAGGGGDGAGGRRLWRRRR
jgi:multiple sugar transport system ATP-binding protein